ncbi:hypothetical protein [Mucilaginibacter pocheonensis]|uniref:Lipocalin-like domain-containing protein n=1 Tax=Mucilaginibacter pocheonensis TaxID=398050 RepID=A0ABU1TI52_9SPHI|nr:hypothetical protein [Mucilaginibacter pocheonensis]MDR6944900.1 hypothetical protein [Mucilaginibacter pocheonensis]
MKRLFYLLPLLLILLEACSQKSDPVPVPTPLGTFKGKFYLFVRKSTGGYDTVKRDTSLIIKLSTPNKFAVTGDTATVHAGSKGLFQYDGTYIAFHDSTYKAGVQAKVHLVGTYLYQYNGKVLLLQRSNAAQDSIIGYGFAKISD